MDAEQFDKILSFCGLEPTFTTNRYTAEDVCVIDPTKPIIPQVIEGMESIRDSIDANLSRFQKAVAEGRFKD